MSEGHHVARPIPLDPRTARSVDAYDDAAEQYQDHWRAHRPRDAIRKFAALAGRDARVLDVASGPALDVRLLRDAGLKAVSGDLSPEAMRVGKLLFPKGALARWDYRQLPFADATFGGVWAPAALQHLPRRHLRVGLAEFRRVHVSGPIFLTFQEGTADLEEMTDAPAGTVHVTSLTEDEVKALLLDAGYSQVETETRPDLLGRNGVTWVYGWGVLR